jgi:prepilin-type processing-associated H-X9-DG protein
VELLVVVAILGVLAGLIIPVTAHIRMAANRVRCASNMRQIGLALLGYAADHRGNLPPTTHTTAGQLDGRHESWIYKLAPYLGNVDEVRICPADNEARKKRIRETDGLTSYVLNDLIFDPEDGAPRYNNIHAIPHPSRTMTLFVVSDDRAINRGRDHAHCGDWTSWPAILADIEPDRHRTGDRATNRLKGSANHLFADGHVDTIEARDLKRRVDSGVNPGAVPL